MSEKDSIGIVLSEATTQEAACQILEKAERGGIREGMLLLVNLNAGREQILARVGQIVPFNAFYTPGDAWSEARRKEMDIPDEVARRYEIAKLDLLTLVGGDVIRTPPAPGERVYQIDVVKDSEIIFGKKKGEEGILWFGSLSGYKEAPVPLNVEYAPMHMAVFGTTGSGKSYDMGVLIEKMSRIPVGGEGKYSSYPILVVDAHGDYVAYANYVADGNSFGEFTWVKRYVFPEARTQTPDFRSKKMNGIIEPIGIHLDALTFREIAETVMLFHKGTLQDADLQVRALEEGFDRMYNDGYLSIHDIIKDPSTLAILRGKMSKLVQQKVVHEASSSAATRALEDFANEVESKHHLLSHSASMSDSFVDEITDKHGLAIVDFSAEGAPGVDLRVKQLVVTYLATLLLKKFTKFKITGDTRFLIVAIEEAHNFAPNINYPISYSLAKRKLSDISTQGRKFGLSLCIISQSPRFVDQIVVSMCNTFFIHKISHEDISFVRNVTGGLPPSLLARLTTLHRGELVVTGQMNPVPFPLLANVDDVRLVPHKTGETRVVLGLTRGGGPRK